MVLDEVDKVASRAASGSLLDAMLPLLSGSSCARYHDIFLQADINTSRMRWMFCANTLAGVPQPFLDRLVVMHVPKPNLEQVRRASIIMLMEISDQVMDDAARSRVHGDMMQAYAEGGTLRSMQDVLRKNIRSMEWSPPPTLPIPLPAWAVWGEAEPAAAVEQAHASSVIYLPERAHLTPLRISD